jgi:hypothetical protein
MVGMIYLSVQAKESQGLHNKSAKDSCDPYWLLLNIPVRFSIAALAFSWILVLNSQNSCARRMSDSFWGRLERSVHFIQQAQRRMVLNDASCYKIHLGVIIRKQIAIWDHVAEAGMNGLHRSNELA